MASNITRKVPGAFPRISLPSAPDVSHTGIARTGSPGPSKARGQAGGGPGRPSVTQDSGKGGPQPTPRRKPRL